ncbi:MAG: SDR family NAD(P)-dependent oxidoreductase [Spirochaetaceae bacterium]|nr:MAG: SDR family NAD(P)-dependent oxidoreductase [Spirochaetaceae bacterium]
MTSTKTNVFTDPRNGGRAVVTGATSGIGRAYAIALARLGYRLLVTGRRHSLLEAVAEEVRQAGAPTVDARVIELSDTSVVDALCSELARAADTEYLVNNAGFATGKPFFEDPNGNDRMNTVHIDVPMRLMYATVPGMERRGHGCVVNVASLAAYLAVPYASTYVASKAYLIALTECVSLEVDPSIVRIQALAPGYVHTDFHRDGLIPDRERRSRGLIRWSSPEAVVKHSLRCLEKNQVLSVPGALNRILLGVSRITPRSVLYATASRRLRRRYRP